MKISSHIQSLKPSPTITLSDRARQLRKEGRDIISLTIGEPDFDTPFNIRAAAIEAIHNGQTHYTNVGGTAHLREAVCKRLEEDCGLTYAPEQVLVSNGAKHSLANCFQAMIEPGDEVILLAPYWVSYEGIVELYGGKPVIIETSVEQHFKATAEQLEAAITDKTVAILINSPSNPSGVIYSRDELRALADVLMRHPQVSIVTDDIYSHLIWTEEPFVNLPMVEPALQDRTVVINGASKSYAMTGWRIGYAAGPLPFIKAMSKIQSQTTSCPSSISQAAAQEAFECDQSMIADMVEAFKERHDMMFEGLQAIDGIKVAPAHGAFYLFPSITGVMKRMNMDDDVMFANYLLEVANVAIVPGSAFGCPDHFRISTAASTATLKQALERITGALQPA